MRNGRPSLRRGPPVVTKPGGIENIGDYHYITVYRGKGGLSRHGEPVPFSRQVAPRRPVALSPGISEPLPETAEGGATEQGRYMSVNDKSFSLSPEFLYTGIKNRQHELLAQCSRLGLP